MSLWFATVVMLPLISVVSFLVLATIYTVPHLLRSRHKLQPKYPPFGETLRKSLFWFFVNSAASFALSFAFWPIYERSGLHLGETPPWYTFVWQLVFFFVLDDALFYFTHRLLHGKTLYKRIHSRHHRVYAPFAFTGALMHPVEWMIISSQLVVGPLLLGSHLYVVWIWVVFRQWGNAEFHSGFVGPWRVLSLLPGGGGTLHHDLHHARVRGNYAASFTWWDRWLGTELKGY